MHLTERVITDKGLCSKDHGTKKFSRSGGEGAFPTPRDDSCPERRKAADGHVAGKIQQPHKWARLVRNGWDLEPKKHARLFRSFWQVFTYQLSRVALTGFPVSQPSPPLQCRVCLFPVNWLCRIPLHSLVFVQLLYTSRGGLNTYPYFMVFPTNTRVLSKIEIQQMTFGCFVLFCFFGEKDEYWGLWYPWHGYRDCF